MTDSTLGVVVLAAGEGTRMRSRLPKVLHPVAGRAMLGHVLDAVAALDPARVVVVVGPEMESVARAARPYPTVVQHQRLGTAHAVRTAREALGDLAADPDGEVLVVYGDTPLITGETLRGLREVRARADAALAVLGFRAEDPGGYGRLVRDDAGQVARIVEARDASPAEQAIDLCNAGLLCARGDTLFRLLEQVDNDNAKGEYYLTDALGLLISDGATAVAVPSALPEEVQAVNSRADLALVMKLMRRRVLERIMAGGVTVEDPDTTYVDWDVTVGQDTVLRPGTVIRGPARIGCHCVVGPWAHLRPETVLEDGAEVGAFVETKDATLGEDVCVRHLAYIGDCEIGPRTNVGCGTITANADRDGTKHRTKIGADVRLGAGTLLVAPTSVGQGAVTGAGAVVTRAHPVPPGETWAGVPARPVNEPAEGPSDG